MTFLDKLYQYETTKPGRRALGHAISAVVCFAWGLVNAAVLGRPETRVVYECIALAAVLTVIVPVVQIKLGEVNRRPALPRFKFGEDMELQEYALVIAPVVVLLLFVTKSSVADLMVQVLKDFSKLLH